MIDISNIGPVNPKAAEEVERERIRNIKTKAGQVAYASLFGQKGYVTKLHNGINCSASALKWIEESFGRDEWKDS